MPICARCQRMLSTADTRKSRRAGEGRVCKDGVRCHRALSEGVPVSAGEKPSVEAASHREVGTPSESTPGPESISQTSRRTSHVERTKDAATAAIVASAAAPSLAVSRPAPVPAAAHFDDERVDKQFALSPLRERKIPLA